MLRVHCFKQSFDILIIICLSGNSLVAEFLNCFISFFAKRGGVSPFLLCHNIRLIYFAITLFQEEINGPKTNDRVKTAHSGDESVYVR